MIIGTCDPSIAQHTAAFPTFQQSVLSWEWGCVKASKVLSLPRTHPARIYPLKRLGSTKRVPYTTVSTESVAIFFTLPLLPASAQMCVSILGFLAVAVLMWLSDRYSQRFPCTSKSSWPTAQQWKLAETLPPSVRRHRPSIHRMYSCLYELIRYNNKWHVPWKGAFDTGGRRPLDPSKPAPLLPNYGSLSVLYPFECWSSSKA